MRIDQYELIRRLACEHILAGGGVLPSEDVSEDEPITAIANAAFGARDADRRFDVAITGLDRRLHGEIFEATWALVSALQSAAFAFGAAVGLQLHGCPAAGQSAHSTPAPNCTDTII